MSEQQEALPDDPTAACVQFDVRRGDVAANLAAATQGVAAAAAAGADLCVLPEMWSTSFLPGYDEGLLRDAAAAEQALAQQSRELSLVVIGSSVEPAGGSAFNCARVYDRGALLGSYRKVHMFSPNAEQRYHEPGDAALAVDTSAGRIGVMIGYDLRFPALARYYFHVGVEVIVVPAQWPEPRSQHWRTLLRARAIENGVFVVGCNRTGHEASLKNSEENNAFLGDGRIVDPTGEILAAGSGDDDEVVCAELELRTVRTLRRVLPIDRDQRPKLYRRLLEDAWEAMQGSSREGELPDPPG